MREVMQAFPGAEVVGVRTLRPEPQAGPPEGEQDDGVGEDD